MVESRPLLWGQTGPPTRALPTGGLRAYVRFAALGDSATCGVGDRMETGSLRGWARILADAIAVNHDLSFCNLAASGATTADVRTQQLHEALSHRPHLVSLIVGLNDVLRPTWDPDKVRADLLACADALAADGAVLLTVRFHDHSRVLGVPRVFGQGISRRIETLNSIYDEVYDRYGGVRIDLGEIPQAYRREAWIVDRLHPSERGHRLLAQRFAAHLHDHGLSFPAPVDALDGVPPDLVDDVRWILDQVLPWVARRVLDLGRVALTSTRREIVDTASRLVRSSVYARLVRLT